MWWNYYKLANTMDKMNDYETTADILAMLIQEDAHQYDSRVPNRDTLNLRLQKLVETWELDPVPFVR